MNYCIISVVYVFVEYFLKLTALFQFGYCFVDFLQELGVAFLNCNGILLNGEGLVNDFNVGVLSCK